MHIADPVAGPLVDVTAVARNPITLARPLFVSSSAHRDGTWLAPLGTGPSGGGLDKQLHLIIRLVHQQLLRAALRGDALAVNGEHRVALFDIDARSPQWRGGIGVPCIAGNDVLDNI